MAEISFAVEADYNQVLELRKEIAQLEAQLISLDRNASPRVVADLEGQLASARGKMEEFVSSVANVGAQYESMNNAFGTSLDTFTSLNDKILFLTNAINGNNEQIALNVENLKSWQQQAQEAFNSGNMDGFLYLNQQAENTKATIADLIAETKSYQSVLGDMEANAGMTSSQPSVQTNMFFGNENSYNQAKALREEIASLQVEMGKLDPATADYEQQQQRLNSTLSQAQGQLRGMEERAAQAASRLGGDLGGRASEASARLYELNSAISSQKTVVSELQTQLEAAAKALKEATDSGDTSKVVEAQTNYDILAQRLQNASNQLNNLTARQKDAKASFANINGEITRHDSILVKLLGGQEKYNSVIGAMPPAVRTAANSITGMTGAARAFIATPLGAIIAAIVLAIKALTTWFNSSAEGQMAFAKASGYVSGVLKVLKEIVLTVGKAIYTAFTDPQKAVTELWELIKTNIVNRFKAIGGIVKSFGNLLNAALTLDGDKAARAFDDMKDYAIQAATGVEHLTKKVGDYIKKVNATGKAMSELSAREERLKRGRSKWQIQEAELDKKISEARLKMYKGTQKERLKATREAQDLIDQKYKQQIKFAKEERDIIKKRNSLSTNSQQDNDALNTANAKITKLEAERNSAKSMLVRRESSMERSLSQESERRKQTEQKIFDELVKLRQSNDNAEIQLEKDTSKKKLRVLEAEYNKRKAAILKQARELADLNKKAGMKIGGDGLTDEQSEEINKALSLNMATWEKQTNDINKADLLAMQEYLKEYGTFQEKKLAIAKIYAEKIQNATNEGERLRLQKEQDKAIRGVDIQALQQKIDWTAVFGNLNGMMQSEIEELLKSLREYVKTDEFKNSDPNDKKVVTESIERLRGESSSGVGTLNIKELQRRIDLLGETMNRLHTAENELVLADMQLADAQKAYDDAIKNGTEEQQKTAKARMEAAQAQKKAAQAEVDTTKATAEQLNTGINETTQDTITALDGVADGLNKLSSGSLKSSYDGLRETAQKLLKMDDLPEGVKKGVQKFAKSIGSAGNIGAIISAILSILDILKNGVGALIASLIDTILSAVNGIIKNIITGKFLEQIFSSLVNGVRNILNTITFGGLNSILDGSNAREVQAAIDRLTEKNEILAKALDNNTKALDKSKGGAATIKAATDALDAQKEINKNNLEIAKLSGSYHNVHHSWNYYWNGFTPEQNKKIKGIIGREDWDEDIWSLSPDDMAKILAYSDLREAIKTGGKGGYGVGVLAKLDLYAEQAGKIEELTDKLNEKLTGLSFDSLYSSFVSSLMDMDKSAQDFSDDFTKYMMQAVLNARISDMLSEDINKFYDDWAEMATSNGGLSPIEMDELGKRWRKIAEQGLAIRDEVARVTNYSGGTSRQQASTLEAQGMTEDSALELIGRMTAMQITQQEQKDNALYISDTLTTMASQQTSLHDIAEDTRSIIAKSYLELQGIHDDTTAMVKPIKQMQSDIADMRTNGLKVK